MTVRRARGQSLTILGDLAQRTADAGVSDWETVLDEAGVDTHVVSELVISTACRTSSWRSRARCCPRARRRPRVCATAPIEPVAVATADARRRGARRRRSRLAARSAASAWSRRCRCSTRSARGWRAWTTPMPSTRHSGPGSTCSTCTWPRGSSSTGSSWSSRRRCSRERPDGGVGGLYTALTRATRALSIVHARAAAGAPARGAGAPVRCGLGRRRRQRERQRLAVRPGAQRLVGLDRLLEADRHLTVADRRGERQQRQRRRG